ncbi:hypothetical protein EDB84DRAFT_1439699 [Lactarius hengduanensis]|nr:hypothetical protein EDB84DRAFT_1439699 [Lactarius hengduanensis]
MTSHGKPKSARVIGILYTFQAGAVLVIQIPNVTPYAPCPFYRTTLKGFRAGRNWALRNLHTSAPERVRNSALSSSLYRNAAAAVVRSYLHLPAPGNFSIDAGSTSTSDGDSRGSRIHRRRDVRFKSTTNDSAQATNLAIFIRATALKGQDLLGLGWKRHETTPTVRESGEEDSDGVKEVARNVSEDPRTCAHTSGAWTLTPSYHPRQTKCGFRLGAKCAGATSHMRAGSIHGDDNVRRKKASCPFHQGP